MVKKIVVCGLLVSVLAAGPVAAEIEQQYLSPTLIRKIDWILLTYTLRQKGEVVAGEFSFVDASYSESEEAVIISLKSFRKFKQKDAAKLRKAIESIGLDLQSTFAGFNPAQNLIVNFFWQDTNNNQSIYAQYKDGLMGFSD